MRQIDSLVSEVTEVRRKHPYAPFSALSKTNDSHHEKRGRTIHLQSHRVPRSTELRARDQM